MKKYFLFFIALFFFFANTALSQTTTYTWSFSRNVHTGQVRGLAVDANNRLWAGVNTGRIEVYDLNQPGTLTSLATISNLGSDAITTPGGGDDQRGMNIGNDGSVLYSHNPRGANFKINPANFSNGMTNIAATKFAPGAEVVSYTAAATASNGNIVFCGVSASTIFAYDNSANSLNITMAGGTVSGGRDVAISADGNDLFIAGLGTTVQHWRNTAGTGLANNVTYTFQRTIPTGGGNCIEIFYDDANKRLWMGIESTPAKFDCYDVSGATPVQIPGLTLNSVGTGTSNTGGFATIRGSWFGNNKAYIGDTYARVIEFTLTTTVTYSISGTISMSAGVYPSHALTINLKQGGTTVKTATLSTTDGAYSFTGLAPGTYTIEPEGQGIYTFNPATRNVTISTTDLTGQNFTASYQAFSVSGTISLQGGGFPQHAFLIRLTNNTTNNSVTTPLNTNNGTYTFDDVAPNYTYTVTPVGLEGYTFSPATRTVNVTNGNVTVPAFTATYVVPPYSNNWKFSRVAYSGATHGIAVTPDDRIWTLRNTNQVVILNPNTYATDYSITTLPGGTPRGMSYYNGKVYVSANTDVVAINYQTRAELFRISSASHNLPNLTTAVDDGTGRILVAAVTPANATGVNAHNSTTGAFISKVIANNTANLPNTLRDLTVSPDGVDLYIASTGGNTSVSHWVRQANGTYTFNKFIGNYGAGGQEVHLDQNGRLWVGVDGKNANNPGQAKFECWENPNTPNPTIIFTINSAVEVTSAWNASITNTDQWNAGGFITPRGFWLSNDGTKAYISDFNTGMLVYERERLSNISGTITLNGNPITQNVTVRISQGNTTIDTKTFNTGTYEFSLPAGAYTITPTAPGYVFNPVSRNVTVASTDITGLGFTATLNTYTITGNLSGLSTNTETVTIGISPADADGNTSKDFRNGTYSFTVPAIQAYTITPNPELYNFSPSVINVPSVTANVTGQNITATRKTFTISGTIELQGVVTIAKINDNNGSPSTTVSTSRVNTDASGNYTYNAEVGYWYNITPSSTGYWFDLNGITSSTGVTEADGVATLPPRPGGTLVTTPQTVDFNSHVITATIAGTVYDDSRVPMSGVSLTLQRRDHDPGLSYEDLMSSNTYWTGGGITTKTTTSGSDGKYEFDDLDYRADYRIIPSGGTFVPSNRVFVYLDGNKYNENFVTSTNTVTLSGNITAEGEPAVGVIVGLTTESGPIPFGSTTVTDNSGNYTFTVLEGNTYRITPLEAPTTVKDHGYERFIVKGGSGSFIGSIVANGNRNGLDFTASVKSYNITVNLTVGGNRIISGVPTTLTLKDNSSNPSADRIGTIYTIAGRTEYTYTFTNVKGLRNYTITPTSLIYNYTNASESITNLTGNQTKDFTALPGANLIVYDVSGIITLDNSPVYENVAVELKGGIYTNDNPLITTVQGGKYTFSVLANYSYTITPLMDPDYGYTFTPPSQNTGTVTANINSGLDFIAMLRNDYTIRGTVWNGNTKTAMSGVTLNLYVDGKSDPVQTVSTSGSGTYVFTALTAHQNYTVIPQVAGYTFSPGSKTFTNLQSYITGEDFVTTENSAEISGYVRTNLGDVATGVNGIIIRIATAGDMNFPFTTTVTTDNQGYYSLRVPMGSRYTIAPQATVDQGYSYAPTTATSSLLTTDGFQQNFVATLKQYKIAGTVWDKDTPLSGVTVIIKKFNNQNDTNPASTITITTGTFTNQSAGYYERTVDARATYEISVAKLGTVFVSGLRRIEDLVGDRLNEDFITIENSFMISGYVRTDANVAVAGITMSIINTGTDEEVTTITQATGLYEINVPSGQIYRILPPTGAYQGYSFIPSGINTPPLMSNLLNQNFTATLNTYTISGRVYHADGTPMIGVPVSCTGQTNVLTNQTGSYSFTVLALGTYEVRPTVQGVLFSPSFARFESLLRDQTQDFRQTTDRGIIDTDPQFIEFGDGLVGRTTTQELKISNSGSDVFVQNLLITGADATCFTHDFNNEQPIKLGHDEIITVTLYFTPTSLDGKNALLTIYHNGVGDPVEVSLTGNGVRTLVTLDPFDEINFGQVAINSGVREHTIQIVNTSPYEEDILTLSNAYFDTIPLFGAYGPYDFPSRPLQTGGKTSVPITITFSPTELGDHEDYLIIPNTSANMQDAKIKVVATVYQGYLEVTPSAIDYDVLEDIPNKDQIVTIRNISTNTININEMYITGDDDSFILLDDAKPTVLEAQQTTTVTVRFQPTSRGKKTGIFNIINDYQLTPHMQVPLTGMAGHNPKIYTEVQSIDFGTMSKGMTKDIVLTVQNVGSTNLVISSRTFLGPNADMFSIASPSSGPIIPAWESRDITIRATALLPNETKSAQLQLTNSDPDNSQYTINLLATVTSSVLVKNFNAIMFDSLALGYSQDTVLVLKNEGNLVCNVTKFEIIGPFSSDFSTNVSAPFSLAPDETKLVNIKFTPLAMGQRYAIIDINLNDPAEPNQNIRLQGWAVEPSVLPPVISIGGEIKDVWDFGEVLIKETETQELEITNFSKHGKLRIDNMELDHIERQPFGYGDLKFPLYINPGQTLPVTLSFNPIDRVRYYEAFLSIQYSDSVMTSSADDPIKILLKGSVISPGINIELPSLLEFGSVTRGDTLFKEFNIHNYGVGQLTVDSIIIVGQDAREFTLNETRFPIKLDMDLTYLCKVRFIAGNIGVKDAKILVYNNDVFVTNGPALEIKITAESKQSGSTTIDITKLDEIPTIYNLAQNYPNPFNPTTKIEYSLIEASRVRLSVYNSLGQEVMNLVDDYQATGKYLVDFNAKNLPSGIYFYRLQSEKFTAVKKMMLLK